MPEEDINTNSILQSIKKAIGPDYGIVYFDPEIIMFINTSLATICQLGAGPVNGIAIEDSTNIWTDITTDTCLLGFIKTYIFIQTKIVFDPPNSSAVLDAMKMQATTLEGRIKFRAEEIKTETANSSI